MKGFTPLPAVYLSHARQTKVTGLYLEASEDRIVSNWNGTHSKVLPELRHDGVVAGRNLAIVKVVLCNENVAFHKQHGLRQLRQPVTEQGPSTGRTYINAYTAITLFFIGGHSIGMEASVQNLQVGRCFLRWGFIFDASHRA